MSNASDQLKNTVLRFAKKYKNSNDRPFDPLVTAMISKMTYDQIVKLVPSVEKYVTQTQSDFSVYDENTLQIDEQMTPSNKEKKNKLHYIRVREALQHSYENMTIQQVQNLINKLPGDVLKLTLNLFTGKVETFNLFKGLTFNQRGEYEKRSKENVKATNERLKNQELKSKRTLALIQGIQKNPELLSALYPHVKNAFNSSDKMQRHVRKNLGGKKVRIGPNNLFDGKMGPSKTPHEFHFNTRQN